MFTGNKTNNSHNTKHDVSWQVLKAGFGSTTTTVTVTLLVLKL